MPKVTVILTSFNHAKYLKETIDGVLCQTFQDFEFIIWDDASTDDSWDIISGYSDTRIQAFRNETRKRGIFGINKTISELAQGEYVAVHHSDDLWHPDKLQEQVNFLEEHPEYGAVFTNVLAIDEESKPLEKRDHFYFDLFNQPNRTRHEWLRAFFTQGNMLCHPSVLIRKECYLNCGMYRFGLAQTADFDMWVRLCLKYEIHVLPEKLTHFRVRDDDANSSGDRLETRSRLFFENYLILKNYLEISSFEDFVKIFPEAKKYSISNVFEIKYVLAMILLNYGPYAFSNLLGLVLIFEELNNPKKAALIKSEYGFDYMNLIALSAQHSVAIKTVDENELELQQIRRLNQEIEKLNPHIDTIANNCNRIESKVHLLEQDNEYLKQQLEKQKANNNQLEQDDECLKQQLEVQRAKNIQLEQDDECLKQQLEVQRAKNIQLEQDDEYLKQQLEAQKAKNTQYEIQIKDVYSSKSWKVTAPLRWTVRCFTKVFSYRHLVTKSARIVSNEGIIEFFRRATASLKAKTKKRLIRLRQKKNLAENHKAIGHTLVSFIIPVYDRTFELHEAIESCLSQTYSDIEVIVVTDGSPPETLAVLDKYSCNKKVKVFHYYDNSGNAVRGRNKGILEASGEFIAFLDSDDIAEKNRIENSLKIVEQYSVDVVYGAYQIKMDDTREINGLFDGKIIESPDCDLEFLKEICVPCQSTVMVRRDALLDVGGLKTNMQYCEDYELWLRLAHFGYKFKATPNVLVTLRIHEGNNELNFIENADDWKKEALKRYTTKARLPQKIVFIIPGTGISGGIAVVLQHAKRLLKRNYDVSLLNIDLLHGSSIDWFPDHNVPIYQLGNLKYRVDNIDVAIATGWSTAETLDQLTASRKLYFIQSDERRFYDDEATKKIVHKTYLTNCEYVTMARWIQKWLKDEFGHDSTYVPNGLDREMFFPDKAVISKENKIRVLLEGPLNIPFKGMSDAYAAIKDIDCEIWIITSAGSVPADWKYDKLFEKVDINKMKNIYSACDILLKMSRVESFCYPPLEAMACGCSVVVAEVTGLEEYAINEYNALIVKERDIENATLAVKKLIENKKLRKKLIENGHKTAAEWSWNNSVKCFEKIIEK